MRSRGRGGRMGLCGLARFCRDAKRSLYVTLRHGEKVSQRGEGDLVDNDPAFRDRWNALAERASLAEGKKLTQ